MMVELTFKEIDRNYEYLNSGYNAIVYHATSSHVIRVSRSEIDGWRVIPYLSEELRERFCLPRILRYWYDEETDYQIAIVERLNKLSWSEYSRNPVNLEVFNQFHNRPIVSDVMKNDNIFYDVVTKAVEAFDYCNNNGYSLFALDLNHSNIMMRDNGELVLSDPFGSRDI